MQVQGEREPIMQTDDRWMRWWTCACFNVAALPCLRCIASSRLRCIPGAGGASQLLVLPATERPSLPRRTPFGLLGCCCRSMENMEWSSGGAQTVSSWPFPNACQLLVSISAAPLCCFPGAPQGIARNALTADSFSVTSQNVCLGFI